jgi:hypothetical protein
MTNLSSHFTCYQKIEKIVYIGIVHDVHQDIVDEPMNPYIVLISSVDRQYNCI